RYEIRTTNHSNDDIYISLIHIDAGGNIHIIYPPEGSKDPIPAGLSFAPQIETQEPTGFETIKVMVNQSFTDYRFLQQNMPVREVSDPNQRSLQSIIAQGLDIETEPAIRTRDAQDNVNSSKEDWCTRNINLLVSQ
ncbi:MAG: hypothetical protein ACRD3W_06730, partial [Terriglobales bacterium]